MTLLEMALEQEKAQWYAGESVWLIPGHVFLKQSNGDVHLCLAGYPGDCLIWYLDLHTCTWTTPRDLQRRYARWAEHAKLWYDMRRQK